jgi:hypothetical protein
MPLDIVQKEQRVTRWWAFIWTLIYLVLLPPFSWMALFWAASAVDELSLEKIFITFTWFWTPLSILVSLYLIWSNYFHREYKRSKLSCGLPCLTFCAFVCANALVDFFRLANVSSY